MSVRIERKIRVIDAGDPQPRPVDYWRTRPMEERFAEMSALHREGNSLFKSGHRAFLFALKVRHVECAPAGSG